MIPEELKALVLPEGYDLLFGDSCIIPASEDYRLFSPKIWFVVSSIYKSAVIDLSKKTIIVYDIKLLPVLKEFGGDFEVVSQKVDVKDFINRHVKIRNLEKYV
jgi:hypothetical protein